MSKLKIDIVTTSEKIFMGVLVVVMLFFIGKLVFIEYSNPETIEITVKDKYIKKDSEKDIYMVVDTDNNTYKVTDLFWKWKFNSTDIYNSLDIGKKYKIDITGVRIRFLSTYKNINKVQLMEE